MTMDDTSTFSPNGWFRKHKKNTSDLHSSSTVPSSAPPFNPSCFFLQGEILAQVVSLEIRRISAQDAINPLKTGSWWRSQKTHGTKAVYNAVYVILSCRESASVEIGSSTVVRTTRSKCATVFSRLCNAYAEDSDGLRLPLSRGKPWKFALYTPNG